MVKKSESSELLAKARSQSPLARSISVESFGPKISSFFNKRKRLRHDDSDDSTKEMDSHSSDGDGDGDGEDHSDQEDDQLTIPDSKKRKVKTKQDEEFEANEKKLDEQLPADLRKFRPQGFKFNLPPSDRPIRIYADGVFDLFHLGHMKQLEQAKKSFEHVELVCGIPSDVETHKRKGLTVLTDNQRIETLKHCRWVDEVVPNAPWVVTPDFLLSHKIDYVAHDDLPYAASGSDDIYRPIKEMGMFLTTQRTDGISTSDIITKIIKDYDKYLIRNFARGATRKELNVSWLKKNELDFKKHVNDFRSYWARNKININNVSRDLYFEVREYLKGKKSDGSSLFGDFHSFHGIFPSDSEDNHSINSGKPSRSPVADFAAKYTGHDNKDLNSKSIFANVVKNWRSRDGNHTDDYSSPNESDTVVTTRKSPRKSAKLANNPSTSSSTTTTTTNSTSTKSNSKSNSKSDDTTAASTSRKIKKPVSRKSKA